MSQLICGDCLGTGHRGSDHVGYDQKNGPCMACDGKGVVATKCCGPLLFGGTPMGSCQNVALPDDSVCESCQRAYDFEYRRAEIRRLAGTNGGWG
jgi:hypothetical protein